MKKSILFLLVLTMTVCGILGGTHVANAQTENETKEQKAERMTSQETFTFDGKNYGVADYPQLYGKTLAQNPDNRQTLILRDDPILQLIPQEYFLDEQEKTNFSEKYSFFINNFRDRFNVKHSIVVIYRVKYENEQVLNPTVKLELLFEYEYLTIEKNMGSYAGYQYVGDPLMFPYNKDYYTLSQAYYCENYSRPVTVAAPQLITEGWHQFSPCHKYYARNMAYEVTYTNLQTPEHDDPGYQIRQDNGLVLSAATLGYQGLAARAKGTPDIVDNVGETIKYGLGFFKPFGTVFTILDGVKIISDWTQIITQNENAVTIDTPVSERLILWDFQNQEEQATAGRYLKKSVIDQEGTENTLLIRPHNVSGTQEYMKFLFTSANTPTIPGYDRNLFQGNFVFNLVADGEEDFSVLHNRTEEYTITFL